MLEIVNSLVALVSHHQSCAIEKLIYIFFHDKDNKLNFVAKQNCEIITIFKSKFVSHSQNLKIHTISIITFASGNSKQRFRSKRFIKTEIRKAYVHHLPIYKS